MHLTIPSFPTRRSSDLTEPQSSGIGGGAFILAWENGQLHAYNGRETAPKAADGDLFLNEEGEALPFRDAVRSGKAVGVAGTVGREGGGVGVRGGGGGVGGSVER